ncbi:MAG: radical SAM protein [Planctomycetes bacterium]|nr:radical SAM protein [Planctomycetota bacterium]MCB9871232.1 radical SAM protein [Planctomycetota bacterium]MCB9889804.1 radical SAM protein [Planctomycetota bacterium]
MALRLDVQYRGDLSSCNYRCHYCPFALAKDSAATLQRDYAGLQRFVDWIDRQDHRRFRVSFTPWGEALIRRPYRDAVVRLSQTSHVERVVVQTNLSGPLEFLAECDRNTVALWCTFHPTQTTAGAFLDRCAKLDGLGVRYSVGAVGIQEDLTKIEHLRAHLPDHVYLWINAFKRIDDYYQAADLARLEAIDPLVRWNLHPHHSRGRTCRTGDTAFSVDARGDVRRCHFVGDVLANLYDGTIESALRPRTCPNDVCRCYIGYIHLDDLGLDRVYGEGLIERIPSEWPLPGRDAHHDPVAGRPPVPVGERVEHREL